MENTVNPMLAMSTDFFEAFSRLPNAIRKKAQTFLAKFMTNSRTSGLNYEKINDAPDDFRSVRIDDNYRAILSRPKKGNVYLLLWVDTHDEAYQWARTHVCNINRTTGSMQVYQSVTVQAPEVPEPQSTDWLDQCEPLFKPFNAEALESIGVPSECLTVVYKVRNRDELESIRANLPLEAFESLVWLAEGEPLDVVQETYKAGIQTDDPAVALKTMGSQRTFRVIESDEEMMQIVDASLEQWRVFLHPTQKRLVEREAVTPMMVRGAAGTGKTVVAMHRAVNLVRRRDWNPNLKLLFTTFTKNLAVDISAQLDSICSAEEKRRIEVVNIDAWVAAFLKRHHVTKTIAYPGLPQYDACWNDALTLTDLSLGLPNSFYEEEWKRVILPQEIMNEKEYLRASRKGRGTPLSRNQRKAVWPVFDEMRNQMSSLGLMTIEDGCFMAIHILKTQVGITQYQAVVVDETQDLGNEALTLLARLALPNGDEAEEPRIFLVGDGQQRIYSRHGTLSSCGINVRGRRSERLKLTYRTTEEIRRAANAVLEGVHFDDMDEGSETVAGCLSNRHGVRPEVFVANSINEEADWIEARIQEVKTSLNLVDGDICVVARTNAIADLYRDIFVQKGFTTVKLSRKSHDDRGMTGLRFATMHRVKGLEYKAVFIVDAAEGKIPLMDNVSDDEEEKIMQDLTERSLFYVSASRAKDALFVSCAGEPGAFMKLLMK